MIFLKDMMEKCTLLHLAGYCYMMEFAGKNTDMDKSQICELFIIKTINIYILRGMVDLGIGLKTTKVF